MELLALLFIIGLLVFLLIVAARENGRSRSELDELLRKTEAHQKALAARDELIRDAAKQAEVRDRFTRAEP